MKILSSIISEFLQSLELAFKDKFILFIFLGTIVIALLMLLFFSILERKRKKRFKELSKTLNWSYTPMPEKDFINSLGNFNLFARGLPRRAENILTGVWNNIPLTVFYYSYFCWIRESGGWTLGIVAFSYLDKQLPSFFIMPKSYSRIIGDFLGLKPIYPCFSFNLNPNFSGNFAVKGTSEDEIRKTLTPKILDYLEQRRGINIEVSGNRIIIYYLSWWFVPKTKPEEIKNFIQEVTIIIKLFNEIKC